MKKGTPTKWPCSPSNLGHGAVSGAGRYSGPSGFYQMPNICRAVYRGCEWCPFTVRVWSMFPDTLISDLSNTWSSVSAVALEVML